MANNAEDLNPSMSKNGELVIAGMTDMTIFLKAFNIPSMNLGQTPLPTPDHDGALPSDKVIFDPLVITFQVDEKHLNNQKMVEWMLEARKYGEEKYKNIELIIYNNAYNPIRSIVFRDAWPFVIGDIQYDQSDDIELINTATFKYDCWEYTDKYL